MKGMIWNCEYVEWNYPTVHKHLDDCLLIFICFESGDTEEKLDDAIRRINQLDRKRFNRKGAVVFPYAHLSHEIMPIKEATIFFEKFGTASKKDFEHVEELPFNKDKNVEIDLRPKAEDVSFFEY